MKNHYKYETIGELQSQWNRWLGDGSPVSLVGYAPSLQQGADAGAVSFASAQSNPTNPAKSNVQLGSFERRTPPENILAQTAPSALKGLEGAKFASGESYYRDRLRAVASSNASTSPNQSLATAQPQTQTSSDLRAVAPAPSNANAYPLQAYQASRHDVAPPQRNSVQVLDWGNSQPVGGLANAPQMMPLMR